MNVENSCRMVSFNRKQENKETDKFIKTSENAKTQYKQTGSLNLLSVLGEALINLGQSKLVKQNDIKPKMLDSEPKEQPINNGYIGDLDKEEGAELISDDDKKDADKVEENASVGPFVESGSDIRLKGVDYYIDYTLNMLDETGELFEKIMKTSEDSLLMSELKKATGEIFQCKLQGQEDMTDRDYCERTFKAILGTVCCRSRRLTSYLDKELLRSICEAAYESGFISYSMYHNNISIIKNPPIFTCVTDITE